MPKKCKPLWREANFEVNMWKLSRQETPNSVGSGGIMYDNVDDDANDDDGYDDDQDDHDDEDDNVADDDVEGDDVEDDEV